jgi:hypothetical protein
MKKYNQVRSVRQSLGRRLSNADQIVVHERLFANGGSILFFGQSSIPTPNPQAWARVMEQEGPKAIRAWVYHEFCRFSPSVSPEEHSAREYIWKNV